MANIKSQSFFIYLTNFNLLFLLFLLNIVYLHINNKFKTYKTMSKRLTRKMNEETKKKISQAMKGKKKSDEHKKSISESMKKYWETIPVE